MVEPRRLIVSREMGSRSRWVILTVRSAVFICGETEVMVPWMIVPFEMLSFCRGKERTKEGGGKITVLQLNGDRFVRAFH